MAAPLVLLRARNRPGQNTQPDKGRATFLHCLNGILGRSEDEKSRILISLLFPSVHLAQKNILNNAMY